MECRTAVLPPPLASLQLGPLTDILHSMFTLRIGQPRSGHILRTPFPHSLQEDMPTPPQPPVDHVRAFFLPCTHLCDDPVWRSYAAVHAAKSAVVRCVKTVLHLVESFQHGQYDLVAIDLIFELLQPLLALCCLVASPMLRRLRRAKSGR